MPELFPRFKLDSLNRRLKDIYGLLGDKPRYRIVFSEDEYEIRMVYHTPEGLELLTPQMQKVPKYRILGRDFWERYILERLTVIPEFQENQLTERLSYEPLWVFRDAKGGFLPPIWRACQFIIENAEEAIRNKGIYTKYKDPESNPEEAKEVYEKRIQGLIEELFGDETDTTDALAYGEGIVVPHNYTTQNQNGDK